MQNMRLKTAPLSYLAACCQPTSHCAGVSNLRSANLQQLHVNKRGHATATGVSWSTVPLCGTICRLHYVHRTRHWTYLKINWKLSSSELSTKFAFAALANLRGKNHIIIIIIIIPTTQTSFHVQLYMMKQMATGERLAA